jgi:integrase/recombinase XerC
MRNVRARIDSMLTIWRRHTSTCPHRAKGRNVLKCGCPLWVEGWKNGKRVVRESLGTRDMARARKMVIALESPEAQVFKSITDAITAFIDHCNSEGLKFSTVRKYRNTLNHLAAFCEKHGVDSIAELTTDQLDAFRASRKLKPITSSKELQLLRQFCGFSFDRRWSTENVAKRIKPPRNIKPNDVEPFSLDEVKLIIKACDHIGRGPYERLRVRAMVLTLRYTALRIGDVAMLAHDRFSKDSGKWRIFLRTEKSGKPVFLPIPTELKAALDRVPIPRGAASDCRHYFWNGISSERTMKDTADRSLSAVFKSAMVPKAHAHRFRHTLATELLGNGASFEEVADILGNSPEIVRKHYAKWSPARQSRIDDLMERVHVGVNYGDENQTLQ